MSAVSGIDETEEEMGGLEVCTLVKADFNVLICF